MSEKRVGWQARLVEDPEEQKEVTKQFDDIGPFTITITNPDDILFLHTACLIHTMGNDVEKAKEILLFIANGAADPYIGPDNAVSIAVKEGRAKGYHFPDFYKPLAIAMLKHSLGKAKAKHGE